MARNIAQRDIVADRQRRVAQMRLRHMSLREITRGLETLGVRNERTGRPWGLATIFRDMAALDALWRSEALADTSKVKARLWAEIREVRRAAWVASDLSTVLRGIKQECELLGLDAPTKYDFEARVRVMAEAQGLDADEAVREAQRILATWERA